MELKKQRESKLSLKHGIFKKELKNRFLCLVEVDGEDTLCYIPSSCKLSNFIDLEHKAVLLSQNKSANSRTKYSIFAVYEGNDIILLNMSFASEAIMVGIRNRRFSDLGKRTMIRKEHMVDGYKCDLYIEDTNTIVEIKSLISIEKEAHFPSVYSQRAIDQLNKLNALLDKGYRVCYIFASLNPKVKLLTLNKNDTEYRKAFLLCLDKGMLVKGFSLSLNDGAPILHKSLKVSI